MPLYLVVSWRGFDGVMFDIGSALVYDRHIWLDSHSPVWGHDLLIRKWIWPYHLFCPGPHVDRVYGPGTQPSFL